MAEHITGINERYNLYSCIEDGLLGETSAIKQQALRDIAKLYGVDVNKVEQCYDYPPEMSALELFFHEALTYAGAHHKQWYLEEIMEREDLHVPYAYEKGIAP